MFSESLCCLHENSQCFFRRFGRLPGRSSRSLLSFTRSHADTAPRASRARTRTLFRWQEHPRGGPPRGHASSNWIGDLAGAIAQDRHKCFKFA